jgi:hypothetical protein
MEISGEARQGWVATAAPEQCRGAVEAVPRVRGVAAAAPPEQWRGVVDAALPGTPTGAVWAHVAKLAEYAHEKTMYKLTPSFIGITQYVQKNIDAIP